MWVLESNSDELNGVRRYLRPGKEYLVGRAKYITDITIESKTVSKIHAKFVVGNVEKGSSLLLDEKIPIYVVDLGSKFGTTIDNVQLMNASKKCDQGSQEIIFAKCQGKFRLFWNPVVFTLSGIKLKDIQPLVEVYGIKISKKYSEKTTHVISKQRNTAKNLQALIYGVFVVTTSYVNELIETISLIELDFDHGFPNPQKHIPPDNIYSTIDACSEDFMPNNKRKYLFQGLTFIFFDEKQYFNLSPPVNSASGKAVFCKNTSNVEQIILFMQNHSNAIAVLPLKDSYYINIASKRTKINLINQDDFLEPILKLDLSLFKKNSYEDYDSIYMNNFTCEKSSVSECHKQLLNNKKYNCESSPRFGLELNNENICQVSKKCDLNNVLSDNVDNNCDIKSLEIINDVDKNTVLQKFSNFNRFITDDKMIHQVSDNKSCFISTNTDIKTNHALNNHTDFVQNTLFSPNKLNTMHHINGMGFQNAEDFSEKLSLNEKVLNRNMHETKSYNHLNLNSFFASDIKNSQVFLTPVSQKNEIILSQYKENELIDDHCLSNLYEKGENSKAVEYSKLELNLQKPSIDISSRWDPKWNGRKNFKKFRRAQRTQPTYTQHVRLIEYKPESMRFISEPNKQKNNKQIFKTNINNNGLSISENDLNRDKIKVFSKNIENYFDISQDNSDDDPLKFRL
ncbi:uncharacterized protein T551_03271 [Pneumocystis jirovecii RU7]|uniref:FHA domain-containing protein n=1 Tax=Pneumocystis jirovecii (strain RU7) TaxID=1408657 RepID=A0A0W4ZEK2_PNEJ7|nr:uncharacterized protein T551_03271 [Pneumocystis jirovecii RU7]KTW26809.1 hypothetical protein T551_03271 [Pneumocystis jirovecii RU7]